MKPCFLKLTACDFDDTAVWINFSMVAAFFFDGKDTTLERDGATRTQVRETPFQIAEMLKALEG